VWAVGSTIGPFAGGSLSRPYDRFPGLFGYKFWKDYPYLLPCLFAASFAAVAFFVALFFLKETVGKSTKNATTGIPRSAAEITTEAPLSFFDLMTKPVVLSIANYCLIGFSDACFCALLPLFCSTPIELGGLGLNAPTIGMYLGTFGLLNGMLQLLFLPIVIKRFGPRRVVVMGNFNLIPMFALFPVISLFARAQGVSSGVWALLILQQLLMVIMDMAFGAIFMFVTAAAPNKRSLGSVNGIAQTTVSVLRAVGPATSTSLFAFSLQTNLLGGNAVYPILMILPCVGMFYANRLPREP